MSPETYELLHSYLKERDSVEAHNLLGRPRGLLLDIGCGDGVDLVSLRAGGWQAMGVEPHRRPRVPFWVRGIAERLPFKSTCFDAVACVLVLPHVPDPRALVVEAHRVLRPGGQAVFVVFSKSPLNARIRITGHQSRTDELQPLRNVFSRRGLERLVHASGFRCQRVVMADLLPWGAGRLSSSHLKILLRAISRLESSASSWPLNKFSRKVILLAVKT